MTRFAKARPNPGPLGAIWWLHPAVAFGAPCLVAGLAAYETGPRSYFYFWKTAKYFDRSAFEVLLLIVAVFVAGSLFGTARRRNFNRTETEPWTSAIRWPSVQLFFRISVALTIMAYIVWIGVALKNGLTLGVILDVIRGANDATYDMRDQYLPTIPGVTTATQFGVAAIALAVPLGVARGWRTVRWQCALVFLLALVRSFLNSERLALLELAVPFVVAALWLRPPVSRLLRSLTQAAPVLAVGLLYLLFGAGEYFRSWSSFYAARHESSFWTFLSIRLMGYYTTALNNGALLWKVKQPMDLRIRIVSLDFLWHFPVINDVLVFLFPSLHHLVGQNLDVNYANLLQSTANVEFNNPSGIFIPVTDYGIAGGLLYWFLSGLLCGYLYEEFKHRRLVGVFIYPVMYISLIEASRILYWADGRFIPGIFLLLVGTLFVFKQSPPKLSLSVAHSSRFVA